MKPTVLASIAAACMFTSSTLFAQTLQGSVGIGLGAADNQRHEYFRIFQVTGGAELLLPHSFAAGGELGIAGGGGDAWVPTSLNGTYYIGGTRTRDLVPYVSGGVTWLNYLTETGHERAYNLGGGLTWWNGGHTGVRLDIRDVIRPGDSFSIRGVTYDVWPTRHWWSVNFGVAFR